MSKATSWPGFYAFVDAVIRSGLPQTEERVAIAIARLYNPKEGCAWPSMRHLSDATVRGKRAIVAAVHRLEADGWITVQRPDATAKGANQHNAYVPRIPSPDLVIHRSPGVVIPGSPDRCTVDHQPGDLQIPNAPPAPLSVTEPLHRTTSPNYIARANEGAELTPPSPPATENGAPPRAPVGGEFDLPRVREIFARAAREANRPVTPGRDLDRACSAVLALVSQYADRRARRTWEIATRWAGTGQPLAYCARDPGQYTVVNYRSSAPSLFPPTWLDELGDDDEVDGKPGHAPGDFSNIPSLEERFGADRLAELERERVGSPAPAAVVVEADWIVRANQGNALLRRCLDLAAQHGVNAPIDHDAVRDAALALVKAHGPDGWQARAEAILSEVFDADAPDPRRILTLSRESATEAA